MRIARGEWEWPAEMSDAKGEEGEELTGPALVRCEAAKRIVSRLLVRDPRKRARIQDLWEDEWMRGDGAPVPPPPTQEVTYLPTSGSEQQQQMGLVDSPMSVRFGEGPSVDGDASVEEGGLGVGAEAQVGQARLSANMGQGQRRHGRSALSGEVE